MKGANMRSEGHTPTDAISSILQAENGRHSQKAVVRKGHTDSYSYQAFEIAE